MTGKFFKNKKIDCVFKILRTQTLITEIILSPWCTREGEDINIATRIRSIDNIQDEISFCFTLTFHTIFTQTQKAYQIWLYYQRELSLRQNPPFFSLYIFYLDATCKAVKRIWGWMAIFILAIVCWFAIQLCILPVL